MKGLTEEQEKIVMNILRNYPEYDFFAYGSRIKGNFVKSSDLDILIHGDSPAPEGILAQIKDEFYNSSLPFIVNIFDFFDMDKEFYEHIKKDLIKL